MIIRCLIVSLLTCITMYLGYDLEHDPWKKLFMIYGILVLMAVTFITRETKTYPISETYTNNTCKHNKTDEIHNHYIITDLNVKKIDICSLGNRTFNRKVVPSKIKIIHYKDENNHELFLYKLKK